MLIKSDASDVLKSNKFIIVDNDFLGLLFYKPELFKDIKSILNDKKMFIYPFTEFEFLRDVFEPEQRLLKEKFIQLPSFGHAKEEKHLKIFPELLANALLISKIYAHQNVNKNQNNISFIDLLLASFLMYLKDKVVLITGNKRHFHSSIFDINAVLNFEDSDGNIRSISIISFNQNKFDLCNEKLNKLDKI